MSVTPPRQPATARRLPAGFSLPELLLVLAIAGVTAGLAIPRYAAATEAYRADAAARRLAADIATLRSRARALAASQSMTFTAGAAAGAYAIGGMADPDRPSTTYAVDLTRDPYRATITSAKFGASNAPTLTFGGYGMPAAGGTVVLTAGKATRTIAVDPTSGEVTIQ